MGKLMDDMTRLVDEIHTMGESRSNFIKRIQDETRRFIADFRNEMNSAHEAFFGTRHSFGEKTSRKRKTVQEM